MPAIFLSGYACLGAVLDWAQLREPVLFLPLRAHGIDGAVM